MTSISEISNNLHSLESSNENLFNDVLECASLCDTELECENFLDEAFKPLIPEESNKISVWTDQLKNSTVGTKKDYEEYQKFVEEGRRARAARDAIEEKSEQVVESKYFTSLDELNKKKELITKKLRNLECFSSSDDLCMGNFSGDSLMNDNLQQQLLTEEEQKNSVRVIKTQKKNKDIKQLEQLMADYDKDRVDACKSNKLGIFDYHSSKLETAQGEVIPNPTFTNYAMQEPMQEEEEDCYAVAIVNEEVEEEVEEEVKERKITIFMDLYYFKIDFSLTF